MVGDTVWLRGEPVMIVSEPFLMYGKMFVTVEGENGKESTMMAPDQVAANVAESQRVWAEQQAGFKRLHDSAKAEA